MAQAVSFAASLTAHTPAPLQVSGFVQTSSVLLPHAVPTGLSFGRHSPAPLQLSAALHTPAVVTPQGEPSGVGLEPQRAPGPHVSVVQGLSSSHSVSSVQLAGPPSPASAAPSASPASTRGAPPPL